MKNKFTIGADPEVFVSKGGKFVCAYGLIPGDKKNPFKVDKGAVQVDGVALEFNIDPANSYEEFQHNLNVVKSTLKSMVPDHDFMDSVTIRMDEAYTSTLPGEALVVGCSPDVNAYTEEPNEPPKNPLLRAVGGHLHIGGIFKEGSSPQERYKDSLRMARLMDKHVGVYSIIWDGDNQRRKIYGLAGSCRPKIDSYGVEYRTLSNKWINSQEITKFIYDQTYFAVEDFFKGGDVESEVYRDIIDNSERYHAFFKNNPIADHVRKLVA